MRSAACPPARRSPRRWTWASGTARLVDQIGRDESRRQDRPGLDHHARDAATGERRAAPRQDRAGRWCPPRAELRRPPRSAPRSCPGAALSSTKTQSSVCVAVFASLDASGSRSLLSSTTRTGERCSMPGSRQVSCGSSDSTVPMPVTTASFIARIRCTRVARRLSGDRRGLAARRAPPCRRPRRRASEVTCGRPSRTRRKCPAWACRASSAPTPT